MVHFREGSGWRQTVGCSTWGPSVPIQRQLELMQECHPNIIKRLLLPDDMLFRGGLVRVLWIWDAFCNYIRWVLGWKREKFTSLFINFQAVADSLKTLETVGEEGKEGTVHAQNGRICDSVSQWAAHSTKSQGKYWDPLPHLYVCGARLYEYGGGGIEKWVWRA